MADRPTNCLSSWFPILRDSGAPVPRTRWCAPFDDPMDPFHVLDGETPKAWPSCREQLHGFASELGGCPLFFRTGHTSGKHEWKRTCHLKSLDALANHFFALVEYGELACPTGLLCDVWVLREMLNTTPLFHAFRGRMPITTEVRLFVEGGEVICNHPYWPKDAIRDPDVDDWAQRLTFPFPADNDLDLHRVEAWSRAVSKLFPGAWSIDWLATADRGWVTIDMARAEDSYHWPGCENEERWEL